MGRKLDRALSRVPARWRDRFDSWPFWVGIAYFGLAMVIVGLFYLNNNNQRASTRQAKDEAIRIAVVKAQAIAATGRCKASVPLLKEVNAHVAGVREYVDAQIRNSEAALNATLPSDPLYTVRVEALARSKLAQKKIDSLDALPIPTTAQCDAQGAAILRENHAGP